MLIQSRGGVLRLIRQHDHGLLSGEMAEAWRGPDGSREVGEVLVLATALHDLGWRELDRVPRLDPRTGQPFDFQEFPADEKYEAASEGIDRVEELHPYAAVLVSLHYSTLGSPARPLEFEEEEETRRVELLEALGEESPGPRKIRADLEVLRLFDSLSLFICLTSPGADPDRRPSWLTVELLRIPRGSGWAGEGRLRMEWRDQATIEVEPFPFREPLRLELPFRDLPASRFPDQEALERAWSGASRESAHIQVVQSSRESSKASSNKGGEG